MRQTAKRGYETLDCAQTNHFIEKVLRPRFARCKAPQRSVLGATMLKYGTHSNRPTFYLEGGNEDQLPQWQPIQEYAEFAESVIGKATEFGICSVAHVSRSRCLSADHSHVSVRILLLSREQDIL
jgi:hypothetical protein